MSFEKNNNSGEFDVNVETAENGISCGSVRSLRQILNKRMIVAAALAAVGS